MRSAAALLCLVVLSGCVMAGAREEQSFEDSQAGRLNACNRAARERCANARDREACIEHEALPCDSQVDNTTDLDRMDPTPSGVDDSFPVIDR